MYGFVSKWQILILPPILRHTHTLVYNITFITCGFSECKLWTANCKHHHHHHDHRHHIHVIHIHIYIYIIYICSYNCNYIYNHIYIYIENASKYTLSIPVPVSVWEGFIQLSTAQYCTILRTSCIHDAFDQHLFILNPVTPCVFGCEWTESMAGVTYGGLCQNVESTKNCLIFCTIQWTCIYIYCIYIIMKYIMIYMYEQISSKCK